MFIYVFIGDLFTSYILYMMFKFYILGDMSLTSYSLYICLHVIRLYIGE